MYQGVLPRKKLKDEVCYVRKDRVLEDLNPALEYGNLIRSVDMTPMLCVDDLCASEFQGHLIYRDSHHLTVSYVMFMKAYLERRLQETVPELFSAKEMVREK